MTIPSPPYCAVIFTSQLSGVDQSGYYAMANAIEALAEQQDGYIGITSARNSDGSGISVSYWRDYEAARAFKQVADHIEAQQKGKTGWYSHYAIEIAEVTKRYSHPHP